MADQLEIGRITNQQADAALAMLGGALGAGYIDAAEFSDFATGKTNGVAYGVCAGNELAGVLLAKILDEREVDDVDVALKKAGSAVILSGQRLGMLKSIVVSPSSRGQGIGSALSRAAIAHLKQTGCTSIITLSWESGAATSSAGMFETLGFQEIARLAEFWREDSIRRGYACPRCGNPCLCSAIMYLKGL